MDEMIVNGVLKMDEMMMERRETAHCIEQQYIYAFMDCCSGYILASRWDLLSKRRDQTILTLHMQTAFACAGMVLS